MSVPRRRIVRPPTHPVDSTIVRRLQRLHSRLAHEKAVLARWQKRLRRAFRATDRQQDKIARLERQLTTLQVTKED